VSSQAPKFRGSVNVILVDVNVRDKKGEPVENLTAADFELFENGKPQDITSFAFEKVAPAASAIVTASTLSRLERRRATCR
jgi:VWFA-related protein